MKFTVYVIENKNRGKYYIGQTADLNKRLARYNNKLPNKKTSYTGRFKGG